MRGLQIILLFTFIMSALLFAQKSKSQEQAIFSGLPDDPEAGMRYDFHKKPNIAVLPFIDANTKAKETEFGRTVSAMLITALRSSTNFSVIERSELQKILSEQVLDLSGLTQSKTRQIQELLKVDVILAGDVSLIENTLHIDARLFDIKSSQVVAALYGSCKDLTEIRSEVMRLAKELEQTYLRQWMGSISINSDKPDAEVYLDDKFVGKTNPEKPLIIDDLLEGKYNLKLIRGGYYNWENEIVVLAKMDRSVKVQLIAKPGSMNIYSEPEGAKIFLDNTFVGITPKSLEEVAEGEHEIRLLKLNYEPWTQKVIVRSFQPTDVKTKLEISPGILTVNSNPEGADIHFKGKFVAKTPHTLSNITPGEVVLRIEKTGYVDQTTSTYVESNEHKIVDITLKEKTGRLTVTSYPEDADIYLIKGGQKAELIGKTPLLNYSTRIGKYQILVEKEDFFNEERTVEVMTDKTTETEFSLNEKPGSIIVSTAPENARVFLNGKFKGRSPLLLEGLEKGDYLVTMRMPYAAESVKVAVRSNRLSKAEAKLRKPMQYVYAVSLAGITALLFHSLTR